MNELFTRTSSSAFIMVGTPNQIKAILAGWMQQYGRDMPLAYILSLHDKADSTIKDNRKSSPQRSTDPATAPPIHHIS